MRDRARLRGFKIQAVISLLISGVDTVLSGHMVQGLRNELGVSLAQSHYYLFEYLFHKSTILKEYNKLIEEILADHLLGGGSRGYLEKDRGSHRQKLARSLVHNDLPT